MKISHSPDVRSRRKKSSLEINVTRRAFLSSKGNTAAGTIQIKKACQKSWQIAPKNEDISKSVSSIDSGAIFPPRLGQDLSRNVPVVSGYAL